MVSARKKMPTPADVRDKEVLSPEELAVVLGCGKTLARQLLAEKVIPSFKVGKLRRVRRADVSEFIERQLSGTD